MPIYEYECIEHGVFERICKMDDRQSFEECPVCHVLSEWIPSVVAMQPDKYWSGYYDRGAGEYFTSRSQRKEWMHKNGMIQKEEGTFDDIKRNQKYIEQKNDAARAEAVAAAYGEAKANNLIKT